MNTIGDTFIPYFFHLSVIHELVVMIPFTPFVVDFLAVINVAPHRLLPTYEGPSHNLGVFFLFQC